MLRIIPTFLSVLLTLAWLIPAEAAVSVAVFPIQDISQGDDGVNWAVTDQISSNLQEMGMEVASRAAVLSFMARHRLRALGQLNTYSARRAKRDLGVSLVLVGSVLQRQTEPNPGLAMVLYLLRTEDGKTIWSNTKTICGADTIRLLGIDQPSTPEAITPTICQDILASWPRDINAREETAQSFNIESSWLRPTYIRTGGDVQCSVRLRTLLSPRNRPHVSFKVGDRMIPAEESAAEGFFEAAWHEEGPDGRYPVSLVVDWPNDTKQTILLSSYFVDNQPPQIDLELRGVELHGKTTFRDRLLILPRQVVREPIQRWQIEFNNIEGKTLLSQDGSGQPPERLFWRGQGSAGEDFPEGDYLVTMKVWDRAGNMALSSKRVTVYQQHPQLKMTAKIAEKELVLDINHEGKLPIAFWRLDLRIGTKTSLKHAEGTNLPAQVTIPIPTSTGGEKITARGIVQDILGNKSRLTIDDVMALTRPDTKEKKMEKKDEGWVEEF